MSWTIKSAQEAIEKGELTSVDLLKDVYKRVDAYEAKSQAYLSLEDRDVLLKQAAACDEQRQKKGKAPHGIPIAIKDNIAVKGLRLTAASKTLENFVVPYDATIIKRLRQAGYLFIGKANLDEWAFGSSTEHSAYHVTKNPIDLECVPGGSSGGSGAVVSYGGALAALGSDTGGSIRLPASYCGIYALKPTYGSVSRFGLIAFGSSLDQIGPMTRSLDDLSILLKELHGKDPYDETSRAIQFESEQVPDEIVLGVPKNIDDFLDGCDEVVLKGYQDFLKFVGTLPKVKTVALDLKPLTYALPIYYIIAPAEASSNLSRYDGIRYGQRVKDASLDNIYRKSRALMGDEAKLRILVGTFALSAGYQEAYYGHATKLRNQLRGWMVNQLDQCHAIVIPTANTKAFKIGEKKHDPIAMYKSDTYTVAVNLTGIPALSCPHYTTQSHLPMGIQFLGKHGQDYALCSLARVFSDFFEVREVTS